LQHPFNRPAEENSTVRPPLIHRSASGFKALWQGPQQKYPTTGPAGNPPNVKLS
jgi:hypothetical protein